jgi:DNA polymerase III epsilon subunit-like protein
MLPKKLPKEVVDFIYLRMAQETNNAKIAEEAKSIFTLDIKLDSLRSQISKERRNRFIGSNMINGRRIKRLFFDIETSPCLGWFWRPGYNQTVNPNQIIEYAKIICISYKWHGEDAVHSLKWDEKQDDRDMLSEFMDIMDSADESVAHNGDKFDEKWLRTRCIYHSISALPKYKTLDTLKKARQGFVFPSNRLDEIGKYLGVGRKIYTEPDLWKRVWQDNDRKALEDMVQYCNQDVILLEDVFNVMNPYISNNTNATALIHKGKKFGCPECGSNNTELYKTATTSMGTVQRWMKSSCCDKKYKITNKSYMKFMEYKIAKGREEAAQKNTGN